MKLTRASTYATHAVCELASGAGNRPQASHTIARARGIPERFLLKVLKPLADRRILISMKGPNGGYRLAKPAKEISLLEVIEAVDGPLKGLVPFMEHKSNEVLDARLQTISDAECKEQRHRLGQITFAELAGASPRKAAGKAASKRAKAGAVKGK